MRAQKEKNGLTGPVKARSHAARSVPFPLGSVSTQRQGPWLKTAYLAFWVGGETGGGLDPARRARHSLSGSLVMRFSKSCRWVPDTTEGFKGEREKNPCCPLLPQGKRWRDDNDPGLESA